MSEDDAGAASDSDICGEPNKTGGACKNPVVNEDGSCWIPNHGPGPAEGEAPGRPTKLSHERTESVCNYLADGYSIRVAAVKSGICEDTYHRWRKRGKAAKESDAEGPFREFFEKTERARVQGEKMWTDEAYEYAREAESFGAVMEILRKRYPESWTSEAHEDAETEGSLTVLLSDDSDADRSYATSPAEADE